MANGKKVQQAPQQQPRPLSLREWAELAGTLAELQANGVPIPWEEFATADGSSRDRAAGFLLAVAGTATRLLKPRTRAKVSAVLTVLRSGVAVVEALREEPVAEAGAPDQYPREARE